MAAEIKPKRRRKRDKTVYITEQDPNGDYVSIAEYIRRRHKKDLEKDATASPLYHTALIKKIREGLIPIFVQGKSKFIDWNKSGDFLFKRNFQMPVKRTK